MTGRPRHVVVIGMGNRYRGDDAAGLDVAAGVEAASVPGVRVVEEEGEPTALIDRWAGADAVFLVDAVSSGREPGTVHRLEAGRGPLAEPFARRGTHALSVADVVELARALDRFPPRLVVYGVEGQAFGAGVGVSPAVAGGVRSAVARILEEIAEAP